MRFISLLLLGLLCLCGVCSHWSVCGVVLAPCAVNVMRVLLFVCDMNMLRQCENDGNAGVGTVWLR